MDRKAREALDRGEADKPDLVSLVGKITILVNLVASHFRSATIKEMSLLRMRSSLRQSQRSLKTKIRSSKMTARILRYRFKFKNAIRRSCPPKIQSL